MPIIRFILGRIITVLDFVFSPKVEVHRSPGDQLKVDHETAGWQLYHLPTCPFCVKVRREMKRLGITIPLKDVRDPKNQNELMAGGKQDQVPCLNMGETWMYESSEINEFLCKQFGRSV